MCNDASGFGYAAVFGGQWLQGNFPSHWEEINITAKELLPIVLALRVCGPELSNNTIHFFTDNMAAMHIINKQTSKDKLVMNMVRYLVLTLLTYNIDLRAKHIPGKSNIICDLLSRFQTHKARRLLPALHQSPVTVTHEWLPW